jgi:hypothetical protein
LEDIVDSGKKVLLAPKRASRNIEFERIGYEFHENFGAKRWSFDSQYTNFLGNS